MSYSRPSDTALTAHQSPVTGRIFQRLYDSQLAVNYLPLRAPMVGVFFQSDYGPGFVEKFRVPLFVPARYVGSSGSRLVVETEIQVADMDRRFRVTWAGQSVDRDLFFAGITPFQRRIVRFEIESTGVTPDADNPIVFETAQLNAPAVGGYSWNWWSRTLPIQLVDSGGEPYGTGTLEALP